jgi:hypothetical protein
MQVGRQIGSTSKAGTTTSSQTRVHASAGDRAAQIIEFSARGIRTAREWYDFARMLDGREAGKVTLTAEQTETLVGNLSRSDWSKIGGKALAGLLFDLPPAVSDGSFDNLRDISASLAVAVKASGAKLDQLAVTECLTHCVNLGPACKALFDAVAPLVDVSRTPPQYLAKLCHAEVISGNLTYFKQCFSLAVASLRVTKGVRFPSDARTWLHILARPEVADQANEVLAVLTHKLDAMPPLSGGNKKVPREQLFKYTTAFFAGVVHLARHLLEYESGYALLYRFAECLSPSMLPIPEADYLKSQATRDTWLLEVMTGVDGNELDLHGTEHSFAEHLVQLRCRQPVDFTVVTGRSLPMRATVLKGLYQARLNSPSNGRWEYELLDTSVRLTWCPLANTADEQSSSATGKRKLETSQATDTTTSPDAILPDPHRTYKAPELAGGESDPLFFFTSTHDFGQSGGNIDGPEPLTYEAGPVADRDTAVQSITTDTFPGAHETEAHAFGGGVRIDPLRDRDLIAENAEAIEEDAMDSDLPAVQTTRATTPTDDELQDGALPPQGNH